MFAAVLAVAFVQQVLPAGPLTQGGLADAREPRVSIGVMTTTLFADSLRARSGQGFPAGTDAQHDVQGVVQLGTNMPLLRAGRAVLSVQGGIISRFRLQAPDNDLLSIDYLVALPLNYRAGAYAARVRLVHRSSHLGDELVQNTTIRRLEFTHEEVDALIAREFGPWRAYVGGALTLSSFFPHDKRGVQVGADGRWRLTRAVAFLAGADWQRHTLAEGISSTSATAGFEIGGPGGHATLLGQYLDGATPLGEFFLEREHYWGISVVLSRATGAGNSLGRRGVRSVEP